jgi:hypothetical protein
LYDPNHPVRFAIETLDSVEEVRIIQGGVEAREATLITQIGQIVADVTCVNQLNLCAIKL